VSKPWACSRCGKKYASPEAVRAHLRDKHKGKGAVARATTKKHDDEPSMAYRAVQAEIDRAMGIPNDDDWLLP